jgi:hypothetical protein
MLEQKALRDIPIRRSICRRLLPLHFKPVFDAVHLIKYHVVANPDAMTNTHEAVTHFFLAFTVLSETEYFFSAADQRMPYPDIPLAPAANMYASYHPNSHIYRQHRLSDGRDPPTSVFWSAITRDVAICVLWYAGVWRFASLLQAWLNPDFYPKAGVIFRPFVAAYGMEIVWTSKGVPGCLLQAVMIRPIRILTSYIFAWGADCVTWLRRS